MPKFWPFPLFRNCQTNPDLTTLFLRFAEAERLSVVEIGPHQTTVVSEHGLLRFWTANRFYAWASEGEYTPAGSTKAIAWKQEMPGRYAVKKMAERIPQYPGFALPAAPK